MAGAVLALITGLGGYIGGVQWPPLIDAWPPWDAQSVTLTEPASSDPLTICAHLSGKAEHLAKDQSLAVGLRERRENRWFFDGRGINVQEDGTWTFDVRLGSDVKDTTDRTYDIAVLVLPTTDLLYLESTNRTRDANQEPLTFWSSTDLPPHIVAQHVITRTRVGRAGGAC